MVSTMAFHLLRGLQPIPRLIRRTHHLCQHHHLTHAARRCSLHSGFRQSVLCHILSKINVRSFVSMYPHDHCAVPAGTRVTQQKGRAIQNNRSPDENFMLGGLAVNCEALRRPVRAPSGHQAAFEQPSAAGRGIHPSAHIFSQASAFSHASLTDKSRGSAHALLLPPPNQRYSISSRLGPVEIM